MEYLALSAGRQSYHEEDENAGQDHQGDRECRHAQHGWGPVVEEVGFSEKFSSYGKIRRPPWQRYSINSINTQVYPIVRGVLGNKCAGHHNLKTVKIRETRWK